MNGDFFLNVDIIIYVYLLVKNHQKISSFLTNITLLPFLVPASRRLISGVDLRIITLNGFYGR